MASKSMTPTLYQSLAAVIDQPRGLLGRHVGQRFPRSAGRRPDAVPGSRDRRSARNRAGQPGPSFVTNTLVGLISRCSFARLVQRIDSLGQLPECIAQASLVKNRACREPRVRGRSARRDRRRHRAPRETIPLRAGLARKLTKSEPSTSSIVKNQRSSTAKSS